jgi:hypothetical protein
MEAWREEEGKEIPPLKDQQLIEDLVGNEENEYPVPNHNRMMINMTNELNYVHKKSLKEEIMSDLIEILTEKHKI